MAGRSHSRARYEAEQRRIAEAATTPTPPRTAPASYDPALCDEIEQLAEIGMVTAEIAAHWRISEETFAQWREAHPQFEQAFQRARTRAKAWWQRQPRLAIREKDNKFPAGAWSQQVRALFPEYDDKRAVTVNLNLRDLVLVDLSHAPELPAERKVLALDATPDKASVRLDASPTAETGAATSPLIQGEARSLEDD